MLIPSYIWLKLLVFLRDSYKRADVLEGYDHQKPNVKNWPKTSANDNCAAQDGQETSKSNFDNMNDEIQINE